MKLGENNGKYLCVDWGGAQYRLNYKVTTFPYTTIFSHASGFKVGWQLPTSKTQQQQQQQQARALSARDLRDSAELVLER